MVEEVIPMLSLGSPVIPTFHARLARSLGWKTRAGLSERIYPYLCILGGLG